MPTGFDEAFSRVKELVADFRANEKFYLSPAYQEQEARHDFIDKFWLALGWDVNHENPGGETHKFQGLNFQKGNVLGRMHPRNDGRCLFKKETFAGDGCHPVKRQQRHRIEIGIHSSRTWNQRLAAAPAAAWEPRFRFPPRTARVVCGRLLLARLPKAWAKSRKQPRLLAPEARTEQAERQDGFKTVAKGRLACVASLGTRPKQPRVGHQKIGFWIECQLTIVDHASLKP